MLQSGLGLALALEQLQNSVLRTDYGVLLVVVPRTQLESALIFITEFDGDSVSGGRRPGLSGRSALTLGPRAWK